MKSSINIGTVPWDEKDIKNSIPDFLNIYKDRPIKDNTGGMLSPHMYATWFILTRLQPKYVIESGVWKGMGTWLIEKTLPSSKVISIDVNLNFREYISKEVEYFNVDFNRLDWSDIVDKKSTILFFDDHQNALERLAFGKKNGFKKFIFEDNYPRNQGDCFSLKKAYMGESYVPPKKTGLLRVLNFFKESSSKILNFDEIKSKIKTYYEFPPVFKNECTRWGDAWDDKYPTIDPLYEQIEEDYLKIFHEEAQSYTWLCYVELK